MELNTIAVSDALSFLKTLPDECVDLGITSPPYFGGIRDYKVAGQIGQESKQKDYVAALADIFSEFYRVLRPTGSLWLNIGDKYGRGRKALNPNDANRNAGTLHGRLGDSYGQSNAVAPEKQLLGIPWQVAFELQARGWILRSECVWIKLNGLPEGVSDRFVKSHEYLFHLAKQKSGYYFDMDAIRLPHAEVSKKREMRGRGKNKYADAKEAGAHSQTINKRRERYTGYANADEMVASGRTALNPNGRNRRSTDPFFESLDDEIVRYEELLAELRDIRTNGGPIVDEDTFAAIVTSVGGGERNRPGEKHYAPFPEKLIEPAIRACCPPEGVVLDCFMGSGTTALVALKNGKNFIGCDLNPAYVELGMTRVGEYVAEVEAATKPIEELPLFAYLKEMEDCKE